MSENLPPVTSKGWTIHVVERETRYWIEAQVELKNAKLFEQGVKSAWEWAEPSTTIRWFTDGERIYGKELWKLASRYLHQSQMTPDDPYRKLGSLPWTGNPSGTTPQVWREGLEVAIKVKGSQGKPHVEWLKQEHPFTAISSKSDVHANHNEAQAVPLKRPVQNFQRKNLFTVVRELSTNTLVSLLLALLRA